ncbi:MAG: hypothetical protein ACTTKB_08310 [Treponema sp.]
MGEHSVVAAGQVTVTLIHPLWNGGAPTSIEGFKLEAQMIQAQQAMDSSKIIPLANGNTVTITNNNGAGTVTFNVVKTATAGDMVTIASALKKMGDSHGGILKITQQVNGRTESTTFYACTVKSCPPLNIQGNDVPEYQVVWNYGETD